MLLLKSCRNQLRQKFSDNNKILFEQSQNLNQVDMHFVLCFIIHSHCLKREYQQAWLLFKVSTFTLITFWAVRHSALCSMLYHSLTLSRVEYKLHEHPFIYHFFIFLFHRNLSQWIEIGALLLWDCSYEIDALFLCHR